MKSLGREIEVFCFNSLYFDWAMLHRAFEEIYNGALPPRKILLTENWVKLCRKIRRKEFSSQIFNFTAILLNAFQRISSLKNSYLSYKAKTFKKIYVAP